MAEDRKLQTPDTERSVARNYKDLIVWQKAMDLAEKVYTLTRGFPREEMYALKSQIQRAAVSVPSNIAEGQARGSQKVEFQRFLFLSLGSLAEVDTQLELAIRLNYLKRKETEAVDSLMKEVRKMLFGFNKDIEKPVTMRLPSAFYHLSSCWNSNAH